MTVSGAAAETTKKAMSVVPSEPERRDGPGARSGRACGGRVGGDSHEGKPFCATGTGYRAGGMT